MRMVAAAQASGSRAQALADRAAALLFYVALSAGVLTFVYWWVAGDRQHALTRTATVLVIACPHALGLAIPLVIAISTSLGARNGLLVKDRLALEKARELDVVIFDKTGTLTRGVPVLSGLAGANGIEEAQLLAVAAGVEVDSEHPIGRAVVSGAERRGVEPSPPANFEGLPGRGARATSAVPTVTIPSAGTRAPGRTSTTSPTRNCATATSSVPLSFTTSARSGKSAARAPSAPRACVMAFISSQWPSTMMVISVVSSHHTSTAKNPSVAANDAANATRMARLINVIMPGRRSASSPQAPRRNTLPRPEYAVPSDRLAENRGEAR
jgi:magnesium-transporting ATPase (P-type)